MDVEWVPRNILCMGMWSKPASIQSHERVISHHPALLRLQASDEGGLFLGGISGLGFKARGVSQKTLCILKEMPGFCSSDARVFLRSALPLKLQRQQIRGKTPNTVAHSLGPACEANMRSATRTSAAFRTTQSPQNSYLKSTLPRQLDVSCTRVCQKTEARLTSRVGL